MLYIQKDSVNFVNLDIELDPNNRIGSNWNDYLDGFWIKLNEAQVDFLNKNPKASVKEVFDMQIDIPDPIVPDIQSIRFDVINKINEADNNSSKFFVNDIGMWLNKELRNSLLNVTLPALLKEGETNTKLWYEGEPPVSFTIPIEMLMFVIPELELYAKKVYDNTQRLRVLAYDALSITELNSISIDGYPEPHKYDL